MGNEVIEGASVLVVDDEHGSAQRLADELSARHYAMRWVTELEAAHRVLEQDPPEILLAEACLEQGNVLELVRHARGLLKPPIVIVMSARAGRGLIARLMQEGADAYAEKPADVASIERLFEQSADAEQLCRRMARLLVGRLGLKDALSMVRGTMNAEALLRTGSSRRAAAKVLDVDRRYVQRMVQEYGDPANDRCGDDDGRAARRAV